MGDFVRAISFATLLSNALLAVTITVNQAGDTNATAGGLNDGVTIDLRGALNQLNLQPGGGNHTIQFNLPSPYTVTPVAPLPPINLNSGAVNTITIDGANGGNPIILSGASATRRGGLFIANSNASNPVAIQNMTIQNATAQGGNGGSGGVGAGGGMGAGGAIFVDWPVAGDVPNVVLSHVTINSCSALGGNGSVSAGVGGGGGGGLGGDGGDAGNISGGGGGASLETGEIPRVGMAAAAAAGLDMVGVVGAIAAAAALGERRVGREGLAVQRITMAMMG